MGSPDAFEELDRCAATVFAEAVRDAGVSRITYLGGLGSGRGLLRGFVDLFAGGVGLRRGRNDPELPTVGAALDFWRVEAYEPDRLLRLRAEMRLPGRAWLQFEVDGGERGSRIHQTAIFDPIGVVGLFYWFALLPLHRLVFAGTLAGIAQRATPAPTPARRGSPAESQQ
jgi:hypothetical protein